jgi:pimeloyl-ACP methyl ester carboxylesterase
MLVNHDGASLFYEVFGSGDPILLVHGFPLSSQLWTETAEALSATHRVIVTDLRGHGRSDASPETSMTQYAGDLAAVLDAADEQRPVVLAGLSMGGYIAMEFVRHDPLRVRALVLADTRHDADSPAKVQEREALAQRVLKEGPKVVADGMVGKLFGPEASENLKSEWRSIMAATSPQGVAAALRAMGARPDSTDTLRNWKRPCLIIVGDTDAITPPDVARQMHDLVPGSQLAVIPGAGHMTPVEQPEAFAGFVEKFLKTLPELPA